MNAILTELLNQIAPLIVQILGAVVLALASAALLKGRAWLDVRLSTEQRAFLAQLASTAVHLAEQEGIGKLGSDKAAIAQRYVDGELAAHGVATVHFADIEATIRGAVEASWAREIGPTPKAVAPVAVISAAATTTAEGANIGYVAPSTQAAPTAS